MMPYTVSQAIECFHLGFLEVLRSRVDERRYVLKGGVNLRYFFGSDRYSEDIDLDVHGMADWRLAETIDGALRSDALIRLLRSGQITLDTEGITKTKDTQTTLRWRVFLSTAGRMEPVRTKIEFSCRDGETRFALATVPSEIVKPYALRPPSVQHYLVAPATEQKVIALAKRPETQARDVFELDLLLRGGGLTEDAVPEPVRQAAVDAAVELTYADFETQVRPFLDAATASLYDERRWNQIHDYVIGELMP
jgi:hypothetical protein